MKIIRESPEHHFITFLDQVRQNGTGWVAIHCAQSETLKHDDLIEKPEHIPGKLHDYKKECAALIEDIARSAVDFTDATLFEFTDGDLLLVANPGGGIEEEAVQNFYRELAQKRKGRACRFGNMTKDVYIYQKMADERLVSARRMAAYQAMTDEVRIKSIPMRRDRRREMLVLIVEDDRFMAAYASNILNKDFEIVHAKTGEEAIMAYIDHAPNVVLQDIHLPGLNGHETLAAIRKIDPDAYVVMLSVDTIKTNIVEASKAGASGFLKKPFTKERVIAMVQKSPFYKDRSERGLPGQL